MITLERHEEIAEGKRQGFAAMDVRQFTQGLVVGWLLADTNGVPYLYGKKCESVLIAGATAIVYIHPGHATAKDAWAQDCPRLSPVIGEVPSDWRDIGPQSREAFYRDVTEALTERLAQGSREHGDRFREEQDPLEEAWEEILDAAFYLWMARRRRDSNA